MGGRCVVVDKFQIEGPRGMGSATITNCKPIVWICTYAIWLNSESRPALDQMGDHICIEDPP